MKNKNDNVLEKGDPVKRFLTLWELMGKEYGVCRSGIELRLMEWSRSRPISMMNLRLVLSVLSAWLKVEMAAKRCFGLYPSTLKDSGKSIGEELPVRLVVSSDRE